MSSEGLTPAKVASQAQFKGLGKRVATIDDRMTRWEEKMGDITAHGIENDARLTAALDRIGRMEADLTEIKVGLAKITKFSLLDPRGIAVVVAMLLGGGGFATSIFSGAKPEDAKVGMDAQMQAYTALIDRLLPPPGVVIPPEARP